MSISAAAKAAKKSKAFVRRWVERYKATKNLNDHPDRGTWRTTTAKQDKVIIGLFRRTPALTLRAARAYLSNNKRGVRRSMLQKRNAWATENIGRNWSNVIFSDEASFWAWVPKNRAWSTPGEKLVQRTVKHPVKLHVWGCFSKRGFGCLELFTQNLDAAKLLKIYKKGLLKSAQKMFGAGNNNWILQEDNDPKHRSRLCTSWKRENGIVTLDWPSQSPDANPIENVWSLIKTKLAGNRVYTLKQINQKIRETWRAMPLEYAEKLVESMPRRCQAILDNGGDWTVY
ncbi:hypothetical protein NQ318_012004 [Aromia moschata]|uniref:Tc1-like transposase DDE domain-containing protein n=1 Tax=Aromia moschata TaxID=1265417 RepID=A0AAV8Y8F1_9CUCU|nr:hypothetical protein NQ318_012004 [Aromia moschata]